MNIIINLFILFIFYYISFKLHYLFIIEANKNNNNNNIKKIKLSNIIYN
jgi:hypothetical protein